MIEQSLRFGVIGTNTITEKFLKGAREDERFVLSGVTSRNKDTAESFAQIHGVPLIFPSLEDMASSDMVDAVYIATPNSFHSSQAIACMERGKHVLCEKPVASNAKEFQYMTDAAKRNSVVLMEAMKSTLHPNFEAVREALPRIGKVRRYFSSYCQYSSRYDSFKQGTVLNAFRNDLSGGALLDIGVYTIYPMVVLFGSPRTIKAHGSILSSGVDSQGCAIFDYGDMEASVVYSKVSDSLLPTEIQGEEGTISIDRIGQMNKVTFTPKGGASEDISVQGTRNEFYYEAKEFIDTVFSPERMESGVNSMENSMAVMKVMDEIRRLIGLSYPADV